MTFILDPDRRSIFGPGSLCQLDALLEEFSVRRVLLITGERGFRTSGAESVLSDLDKQFEVQRWSDFSPNVDAGDLLKGISVVNTFGPDIIVGVGGGSVMDMAKLLCAFADITDIGQLTRAIKMNRAPETGLHSILIPTTAGSGSEATHFAVVYVGSKKYSIAAPHMLPAAVVLDPLLTLSATPNQRATSGIDAMSQAVESIWAVNATKESHTFAVNALKAIVRALPTFVNGDAASVAEDMMRGSHYAGRAIDISKTTGAHALSYGITKGYGVSHGHAVALSLGEFMRTHAAAEESNLQPSLGIGEHKIAMSSIMGAFGASSGDELATRFESLCRTIGIHLGLHNVGVEMSSLRKLASSVNVERLSNNPVVLTQDELVILLERSF